jgi:transposase
VYLKLGSWTLQRQVAELDPREYDRVPAIARSLVELFLEQWREVQARIQHLERQVKDWHCANEQSRRLADVPGVGPITASAILATVGNIHAFQSGRHFAAWLGLVPKQHSTGGKPLLGSISKRGDGYLRRLLVHGAQAVLRWHRARHRDNRPWLDDLLRRRPTNVVALAIANKNARTIWALLTRGERFAGYRSGSALIPST